MRELFRFPNPVNEVSARLVASGVVVMAVATVALDQPWILVPLCYGFWARVLTGPTLSPLGQLVTRVLTPNLPFRAKFVPGPPKRFAQGIGALFTTTAVILHFGFGLTTAAYVVLALLIVAASLEAFAGFCLGCQIFGLLQRIGLIPESVCVECANVSHRIASTGDVGTYSGA